MPANCCRELLASLPPDPCGCDCDFGAFAYVLDSRSAAGGAAGGESRAEDRENVRRT